MVQTRSDTKFIECQYFKNFKNKRWRQNKPGNSSKIFMKNMNHQHQFKSLQMIFIQCQKIKSFSKIFIIVKYLNNKISLFIK